MADQIYSSSHSHSVRTTRPESPCHPHIDNATPLKTSIILVRVWPRAQGPSIQVTGERMYTEWLTAVSPATCNPTLSKCMAQIRFPCRATYAERPHKHTQTHTHTKSEIAPYMGRRADVDGGDRSYAARSHTTNATWRPVCSQRQLHGSGEYSRLTQFTTLAFRERERRFERSMGGANLCWLIFRNLHSWCDE